MCGSSRFLSSENLKCFRYCYRRAKREPAEKLAFLAGCCGIDAVFLDPRVSELRPDWARAGQQQIPCGNDREKGKNNGNNSYRRKSTLFWGVLRFVYLGLLVYFDVLQGLDFAAGPVDFYACCCCIAEAEVDSWVAGA